VRVPRSRIQERASNPRTLQKTARSPTTTTSGVLCNWSGAIVAMIVHPALSQPWTLSLHRQLDRQDLLRVTRLQQDVWGAMLVRMQELQGCSSVSLAREHQEAALSQLVVTRTIAERSVDRDTAKLLETLWKSLLARVQIVHSDVAIFDGESYYFWNKGAAGTTSNPPYRSVLERVTFAAKWLSHLVETPAPNEADELAYIREQMTEALARARQKEPCVRQYRP